MDLLLQAAKVLEQENATDWPDRVAAKSTRDFHKYAKSKGESNDGTISGDSLSVDDNTVSADDDTPPSSDRRRSGGAGTREVHNQLEKNRRKQLRECFNHLQQCVPSLENKRVATQSILQGAIKHIKNLKKKDVEQEREVQMLAKRKSELKKKQDVEFNRCTEDQQRAAEAILKAATAPNMHDSLMEDDGHTSDSTTTASEGPCNEEDFSDDEKVDEKEKANPPRVNPVVAAKLDGFRKRKLASRDSQPKSTEIIVASMKNAGLLTAPSKSRSGSHHPFAHHSSVSSSSIALKNMLEQKKKQQINSIGSSSALKNMLEQKKKQQINSMGSSSAIPNVNSDHLKVSAVPSAFRAASTKATNSLISSYPVISNQLAAAASLPMATSHSSTHTAKYLDDQTVNTSDASIYKHNHSMSPGSLQAKAASIEDELSITSAQKSMAFAPARSPVTNALRQQATSSSGTLQRSKSKSLSTLKGYSAKSKTKIELSFPNTPITVSTTGTPDVSLSNCVDKGISNVRCPPSSVAYIQPSTPCSPVSINMQGQTSSVSGKVVPAMLPMTLLRSLPLTTGAVTIAPTPITLSTTVAGSTIGVPTAFSPIVQSKLQPALSTNLLLTSPVKADANLSTHQNTTSSAANMGRFATLLTPTTLANSVIKSNPAFINSNSTMSSSVPQMTMATHNPPIGLSETLKTMALTPTLLPFTVTGGPLPSAANPAMSHGASLRFYTPLNPSSVMAAPLTNGQTPLMPTVVQLGGTGQVAVLQNIIPAHMQMQNPQMLAQPIMMVTSPSDMYINPVTCTAATLSGTMASSASSIL